MSTVVLIHAFPLDDRMYDGVVDAIAAAGWDVITPALRGFGGASDFVDEPSLDTCVDDIVAILDRLGIERAVVGGTSIGGYVTMAMMRRAPERMAGAILIDTKATADNAEGRANRLRIAEQVERAENTEAVWRAMLPNALGQTTQALHPEIVEQAGQIMADSTPTGVAGLQRAMLARPDSIKDLKDFRQPVLSIRGSEDMITSAADHAAIVAALPDCVHVDIEAAGHLSPLEKPQAVAAAIIEFLTTVKRLSC